MSITEKLSAIREEICKVVPEIEGLKIKTASNPSQTFIRNARAAELADVLRVQLQNEFLKGEETYPGSGTIAILKHWNLAKSLDEQGEEVVNFLFEILCKKNGQN